MEIRSLKQCKEIVSIEKKIYLKKPLKEFVLSSRRYQIFKYLKLLRYEEYVTNSNILLGKIFLALIKKTKNKLGIKLGFDIPANCVDVGLTIYHTGSIIINNNAKIGKYFKTAGNICIGDSGGAPIIGDNVTFAFGAIAIGPISIADNCYIGAGSVVTKSFDKSGSVICGVPAKLLSNTEEKGRKLDSLR